MINRICAISTAPIFDDMLLIWFKFFIRSKNSYFFSKFKVFKRKRLENPNRQNPLNPLRSFLADTSTFSRLELQIEYEMNSPIGGNGDVNREQVAERWISFQHFRFSGRIIAVIAAESILFTTRQLAKCVWSSPSVGIARIFDSSDLCRIVCVAAADKMSPSPTSGYFGFVGALLLSNIWYDSDCARSVQAASSVWHRRDLSSRFIYVLHLIHSPASCRITAGVCYVSTTIFPPKQANCTPGLQRHPHASSDRYRLDGNIVVFVVRSTAQKRLLFTWAIGGRLARQHHQPDGQGKHLKRFLLF